MSAAITPTSRSSRRRRYLTGAEWNWATVYTMFATKTQKGKPLPNFVRGGIDEGFVKMSPYGPAVSEAARKNADAMLRGDQ